MGKKVTYGIKYVRAAKVSETLKEHLDQYKALNERGKKIEAAQTIIQITEWLLDEIDLGDDPEDPEIMQCFPKAIEYSEKAIQLLEERNDTELLPRAHNNICLCYFKMRKYESAIKYGLSTVNAFKKAGEATSKYNLQSAYKVLGNIYFTKSLNPTESRFEDYRNAHRFYKLEREVIDTMVLSDVPDPKEGDLERLQQSSHFNMGVMESKIPALFSKALQNLQAAIKLAKKLKDYNSEKTAWWELGNLYKRTQQYENVKLCQSKEFAICKVRGFHEDYFYCFEEKMKLYLFLEEYNECSDFYNEAMSSMQPSFSNEANIIRDMVKRVKSSWDRIQKMIDAEDKSAPIAASFLEYIKLLSKYGLDRIIVKKIDTELAPLVDAGDYSNLIYVQLLIFKVKSLWNLRESRKDIYLTACSEIIDFLEVSLTHSMLEKLNLAIKILKMRVKVCTYFGDSQQRDSCKTIISQLMKEENLERQRISHQTSMGVLEQHRITPAATKVKSVTIHATIMTAHQSYEIELKYDGLPQTVQFLMNDISEKCWLKYGFQPILSRIHVSDHDIFPEDLLQPHFTDETHHVSAFVKDFVKKLPIQLYENAAERLALKKDSAFTERLVLEKDSTFIERLSRQTLMEMNLTGLDIFHDQAQIIQEVLKNTASLKILDLSINYLSNTRLDFLLSSAYRGLTELDLSSNQLDAACLDTIILFTNLITLNLSYNNLGPDILLRLPEMLTKLSTLREISLESTHLGRNIELHDDSKVAYTTYGVTVQAKAGISLNISNNHFEGDMLWHWTTMWVHLVRISSLTLSNITSDTGWDNFYSLSDLPKLSNLIFGFSSKSTLALCNLNEFFRLKPELNHLDFTCCDLTAYDIKMLANSLNNLAKLKKLTLNSNPKIGDEGIYCLNDIILQSKIKILYISHCGLTTECQIAPWTFHLKEIDITENSVHDDTYINQLNKETFVRVDDYKGLLTEEDKPETRGLSYRHMSTLPNTPFD